VDAIYFFTFKLKKMNNWIKVSSLEPPQGKIILTRINDSEGVRNEQKLIKKGNLWWFPDMSMYVYYTPTEWKQLN